MAICSTIWSWRVGEVLVELDDELVGHLDELGAAVGCQPIRALASGRGSVLEAEELAAADSQLQEAYRRKPQDPVVVDTARRLAAETAGRRGKPRRGLLG